MQLLLLQTACKPDIFYFLKTQEYPTEEREALECIYNEGDPSLLAAQLTAVLRHPSEKSVIFEVAWMVLSGGIDMIKRDVATTLVQFLIKSTLPPGGLATKFERQQTRTVPTED